MKLINHNSHFVIIHDDGTAHSFKHLNLVLIYCLRNANIEDVELEKAFISMYQNEHNVAHFGKRGTFLYTETKRYQRGQN